MPLVRIDLPAGRTADQREAIVDVISDALASEANVPSDDRFMILSEHGAGTLVIDPGYLGVSRTAEALVIQITLNTGRTVDVKKNLYRAIAHGLHERIGIRTEDVFISLVEVPKENWSFGRGEAQYAD